MLTWMSNETRETNISSKLNQLNVNQKKCVGKVQQNHDASIIAESLLRVKVILGTSYHEIRVSVVELCSSSSVFCVFVCFWIWFMRPTGKFTVDYREQNPFKYSRGLFAYMITVPGTGRSIMDACIAYRFCLCSRHWYIALSCLGLTWAEHWLLRSRGISHCSGWFVRYKLCNKFADFTKGCVFTYFVDPDQNEDQSCKPQRLHL